jgi:hypothetical protein
MTDKLDLATHQTKWAEILAGYRAEAGERWMAVWQEWREQTQTLNYADNPDRLLAEAEVQPEPVKWAELPERDAAPLSPNAELVAAVNAGLRRISEDDPLLRPVGDALKQALSTDEREATLDAMVELYRPVGWTPRAEDFGPAADETLAGVALEVTEAGTLTRPNPHITPRPRGPRGRYTSKADGWLERADTRLRAWARARFTPVKEEQL